MRTKTIIRLAVWMTMATLLEACCMGADDTYHYLSDEETPIWSEGDAVIYKSDNGELDTFFVFGPTTILERDDNNDFCSTSTYTESIYYGIGKNDGDIEFSIDITASKTKKDGSILIKGSNFSNTFIQHELIPDFSFANTLYHNVIEINVNAGIVDNEKYDIIYYNHKYGVIQYILKTGEKWTLNLQD